MDMYTTCVPNVHGGQKTTSDPRELEVHMAISYHVGIGNQTSKSGSSTRAANTHNN